MVHQGLGKLEIAKVLYSKAAEFEPENLIHYYHLTDLNNGILNEKLKASIAEKMLNKNLQKKSLAYGNFLMSRYESNNKNYENEIQYLKKGHDLFFKAKNNKFRNKINYWLEELPNLLNKININKTSN